MSGTPDGLVPCWLVTHRRPVGWLVIGACIVLGAVAIGLGIGARPGAQPIVVQDPISYIGGVLVMAGYGSVFILLTRRVPTNPVGWLFGAVALLASLSNAVWGYITFATESIPPRLPAPDLVALVGGAATMPSLALVLLLLALVYPDGRPLSRGWSLLVVVAVFLTIGATLAIVFGRGPLPVFALASPFALPGSLGIGLGAAVLALLLAQIALFVPALWMLVLRYRASDDIGRLQLKWLVYAMTVFAVVGAVFIVTARFAFEPDSSVSGLVWLSFCVASVLVPLAALVAILRYHLYEIETIISRTLVYGGLTAILAGIYTAGIRLFNWLFVEMTGEDSDVALVLTTLILATTFTPIKAWLEGRVAARKGVIEDPAAAPPIDERAIETERIAELAAAIVLEQLAERPRSAAPPPPPERATVE